VPADSVIHLSYPLAFAAGVVSFLSPCVFPLAPGYLAFLSGRVGEDLDGAAAVPSGEAHDGQRGKPVGAGPGAMLIEPGPSVLPSPARTAPRTPLLLNGLAFVLGFSAVFVAFFYVLRALDVTLLIEHQHAVDVVAGLIVIALALQTLGILRAGWLMRDRRIHRLPHSRGMLGAFLLGVTFAAGWTPCIGPQLAAILAVASQGDFTGLPVMLAYCAGLAVPFLLLAVLADRLQGVLRAVNRRMQIVNVVAGTLLLVFGVLLVTDQFTFFNRFSPQSPFDL
jgi:cytochrome c-type biogenesis protein